jgi:uncharacterized membrane protein YdjX (TVP38/TMEM64 family)
MRRPSTGVVLRLVLAAALVAALLAAGRHAAGLVPAFATWVDGLGAWGPVAFVLGYALACVALLPASLLTVAAGAAFGLAQGVALVAAGATLGASASFLIARHVARRHVTQRLARDPRLAAVDRAVATDGRRIVTLLRLSPAFPFALLNYVLGVTQIAFRDFLVAMFGILPGTTLYVYAGKAAGDVALAASGAAPARGAAYYAVLASGFVATAAVTVLVTRAARRALASTDAGPPAGRGPAAPGAAPADAPGTAPSPVPA